jgi:hypothetical protein
MRNRCRWHGWWRAITFLESLIRCRFRYGAGYLSRVSYWIFRYSTEAGDWLWPYQSAHTTAGEGKEKDSCERNKSRRIQTDRLPLQNAIEDTFCASDPDVAARRSCLGQLRLSTTRWRRSRLTEDASKTRSTARHASHHLLPAAYILHMGILSFQCVVHRSGP